MQLRSRTHPRNSGSNARLRKRLLARSGTRGCKTDLARSVECCERSNLSVEPGAPVSSRVSFSVCARSSPLDSAWAYKGWAVQFDLDTTGTRQTCQNGDTSKFWRPTVEMSGAHADARGW